MKKESEVKDHTDFKMQICKLVSYAVLPLIEVTFMIAYWIIGLSYYYSY